MFLQPLEKPLLLTSRSKAVGGVGGGGLEQEVGECQIKLSDWMVLDGVGERN